MYKPTEAERDQQRQSRYYLPMTNAKRDAEDENKKAAVAASKLRHISIFNEKLVQCSTAYHVCTVEESLERREIEKKLGSIRDHIANFYSE